MRPSAARADLGRRGTGPRALALAIALCGMLGTALAGDRAGIELIGYDEAAKTFAFEEFGIQDGSGFAYSNIFAIDLPTDTWVSGLPIRLRAEDETTSLAQIRSMARTNASEEGLLDGLSRPARFLALIGDGALSGGADTIEFGTPGFNAPLSITGEYRLDMTSFFSTSPEPCESYTGNPPMGFALRLTTPEGEREIYRDGFVPKSRGCPEAYRIHGVVTPWNANGIEGAVAIISVYAHGFEGPDRRFIAVPLSATP